jgi:DegV family protein with EDD domain
MNLKRGGRVSKIEALLGTILGIKPVLELSHEGKIMPIAKARGTRNAIMSMCELTKKYYIAEENDFILVGHGDDIEGAKKLGEQIKLYTGATRIEYCYVNFLVGSHAGPGSLVVYFMGASRVR